MADVGSFVPLRGDRVGERLRRLHLVSSRIDAQVDPGAALSYTEWTLSFENRGAWESLEARALVALPRGGVVSRLTLWVDGEEREAAFAGRSEVRTAYQEVVQKQRDPVLVTTAGQDRVFVQCFPVLPNGGQMKIRLGITAPMGLTGADPLANMGSFRFPSLVERNFGIGELEHSVWIESHTPVEVGALGLLAQQPPSGRFVLRGQLDDERLSDFSSVIAVDRAGLPSQAWTPAAGRGDVSQVIRPQWLEPAERIVFVIDGSYFMAEHAAKLAEVISAVVLETEQQYKRAGLEPVSADTVPILPEPELVLIVLLAAMIAIGSYLARRRRTLAVSR